ALAGIVEARLDAANVGDATVVAGWDGFRVRVLTADDGADATAVGNALRAAMLAPIGAGEAEGGGAGGRKAGPPAARPVGAARLPPMGAGEAEAVAAAKRKLDALAKRPMADAALLDAARCTGEPFAIPGIQNADVTPPTLEAWRRAAIGLGRVAFASAGTAK